MVETLLKWLRLSKTEGLKVPIITGALNFVDFLLIVAIVFTLEKLVTGNIYYEYKNFSVNLFIICATSAFLKYFNYNFIVFLTGSYSYRFCSKAIIHQLQGLVNSASEITESDEIKRVEKLITQNNYLVSSGLQNFTMLAAELIFISTIFLYLSYRYGVYVLAISLLILIIFSGYYKFLKPKLHYVAVERQTIFTANLERIRDISKFAPLAKVYRVQKYIIDTDQIENTIVKTFTKYLVYQANPRLFFELIGIICICVIFYFLHLLDIDLSKETLIVFVAITLRLLPSVGKISQNLNQLQMSEEALREFQQTRTKQKAGHVASKCQNLKINDTEYSFNDRSWILLNGESGTGKTASIRAALGLGEPMVSSKFNIFIPDHFKVAYVPQTSHVRNVDLYENIRFYRPDIDDNSIHEVVDLLDLQKVKDALELSENASALSGGERQRVSLARALVDEPEIILLDEAFTSISEKQTLRVIKWMKKNLPQSLVIGVTHSELEKRYYDKVVCADG